MHPMNADSATAPAAPPAPPQAQPYTARCRAVLDAGEHAVIGLSPFNGAFNPHTVQRLIGWGVGRFRRIDVLLPGYEAIHTLVAAGMHPLDAARRLRRALNGLRNNAVRQLREHGIGDAEARVHTWTRLQERNAYFDLRRSLEQRYRSQRWLRQACGRSATAAVRASAVDGAVAPARAMQQAAQYALAELPFFLDSPTIFAADSSVFVYPRPIALVHDLLERNEILPRHRGQGYVSFHRLP